MNAKDERDRRVGELLITLLSRKGFELHLIHDPGKNWRGTRYRVSFLSDGGGSSASGFDSLPEALDWVAKELAVIEAS